jgi:hypothetical protein
MNTTADDRETIVGIFTSGDLVYCSFLKTDAVKDLRFSQQWL